MIGMLRTYRFLHALLALSLALGVTAPLVQHACAMHHDEGHQAMTQPCCCDDEHAAEKAPCPRDENDEAVPSVKPHHHDAGMPDAGPCCAFEQTSTHDLPAMISGPTSLRIEAPRTLLVLDLPLPKTPLSPSRAATHEAADPPRTGAVAMHVFFASFLI